MSEMTVEPDVVVQKEALVGEGSLWDSSNQVLYWLDILGRQLYGYDPKTGENRTIDVCQAVGSVVPRSRGGVVLATHNGFIGLDLASEKMTPIVDPERFIPANRFNDGKCDPAGRFWAGTMEFDGEPDQGALYCLEVDHTVSKKIAPVTISNGIVWSHDHTTMYYIDTGRNNVRAWDYDIDTGTIRNERVTVINNGEGHFDGMTIDADGMVWIALFGGWGVQRYDPATGDLLQSLRLPFANVTSCALGGEDLDELYITSAAYGLDDQELREQPLAGSLVKVRVEVPGVAAHDFGG